MKRSGLAAEVAMLDAGSNICLVAPIGVPLAFALAAFLLGGRWYRRFGIAASAIVVISASVLSFQIWSSGPQSYLLGNWPVPLGIALYADGLTCVMLIMSAGVGAVVSIYAFGYFDKHPRDEDVPNASTQFWTLWLVMWSALNALFLSRDVFNLYVTLELLSLSAIGLVVVAGTRAALEAALRYLLAALVGSLLYLTGVVLLYGAYGTLDISSLGPLVVSERASQAALVLFMLGLMLKTALFPFHFWLPPAHGSAPAPVSALLSALVVKGSFYILLRLWYEVFPDELTRLLAIVPVVLGAVAILWGSLQALAAERMKMLVAYSTVAQLGYLFIVFGLALPGADHAPVVWSAGVLFALSHALAKGALFLSTGTIVLAAGHDRIRDLASVCRRLPITFFAIALASMSIMGLPPTAAFVAKWTFLKAAFGASQEWLATVIIVGGLLAAAYMFRILRAAFASECAEKSESEIEPIPRMLEFTTFGLALASLLLGLFSSQVMELARIGSSWQIGAVREALP